MVYNETDANKENPSATQPSKISEDKVQTHEQLEYPSAKEDRAQEISETFRERLIPIWLRLVIIVTLFAVCLAAGLAVGYGVIGEGKAMEVFHNQTWQHIIDLVKKDS